MAGMRCIYCAVEACDYVILSENYEYVYADLIFGFPLEMERKGETFSMNKAV